MNSVSSLFALLKNRFYELVPQPKFDDLLFGYGFSQLWHNLWEYLDDDELMGNQDTVTILFEFLFRYLDNNCLLILSRRIMDLNQPKREKYIIPLSKALSYEKYQQRVKKFLGHI